METKIKIMTDTGADVSKEIAEKLNITVLPFTVALDGKIYDEYNDLSVPDFYRLVRTSSDVPKTAQITPNTYYEAFSEALKEYDTVLFVSLSSTLSQTFQNALAARDMVLEEQPDADLLVIDSQRVTFAYGLSVIRTAELIQSGASRDEVVSFLRNHLENSDIFFSFDTLKYIKAGGRISSTKFMAATLLDIKPILHLDGGLLIQFDKVRGSKNVISKLVKLIGERTHDDPTGYEYWFYHTDNAEGAEKLRDAFYEAYPEIAAAQQQADKSVVYPCGSVMEIGAVIGTHSGPGVLAIGFHKK